MQGKKERKMQGNKKNNTKKQTGAIKRNKNEQLK